MGHFPKKVENHAAAIALHFFYYNFVRNHQTVAYDVRDGCWSVQQPDGDWAHFIQMVEKWEQERKDAAYGAAS